MVDRGILFSILKEDYSEDYCVQRGVRQGYPISPISFLFNIERFARRVEYNSEEGEALQRVTNSSRRAVGVRQSVLLFGSHLPI